MSVLPHPDTFTTRLRLTALLKAIGRVPAGDKLDIRALREPIGFSQAECLAAVEQLLAEGRIDAKTLRPPPPRPRFDVFAYAAAIADARKLLELRHFTVRRVNPDDLIAKWTVSGVQGELTNAELIEFASRRADQRMIS